MKSGLVEDPFCHYAHGALLNENCFALEPLADANPHAILQAKHILTSTWATWGEDHPPRTSGQATQMRVTSWGLFPDPAAHPNKMSEEGLELGNEQKDIRQQDVLRRAGQRQHGLWRHRARGGFRLGATATPQTVRPLP